jgi:hypothetical protein
MVQDVDIQLTLAYQACHGEVAAAEIANDRVNGVGPK